MSDECLKLSDVLEQELRHIQLQEQKSSHDLNQVKEPTLDQHSARRMTSNFVDNLSVLKRLVRMEDDEREAAAADEPNAKKHELEKLTDVFKNLSDAKLAALCLSGGGIRSATFNLGVLQGLAQAGLLGRFHYLSTVSGGGFIGSWLSSWIHRTAINDAVEPVSAFARLQPEDATRPDPEPVKFLRRYSNYLTPKVGLLSADSWTLASICVRNLLLTNLVFLPFILAVLMLPRIIQSLMQFNSVSSVGDFLSAAVLSGGILTGIFAIAFIALNLPAMGLRNDSEREFLLYCLMPLSVSAVLLSTFWSWFTRIDWTVRSQNGALFWMAREWIKTPASFIVLSLLLLLIPWLLCLCVAVHRRKHVIWTNASISTLLISIAGILTGWTLHKLVLKPLWVDTRLYTMLAFPLLMSMLMLGGTLVSGLTSRYTTDEDEEWWARSGAWIGIVVAAWIALSVIVLFIPGQVLGFVHDLLVEPYQMIRNWPNRIRAAAAVFGALSTVIALITGFSTRTPATEEQKNKAGMSTVILGYITSALSIVAFVFLLGSFAAIVSPVLAAAGGISADWWNHDEILKGSSLSLVFLATTTLVAAGLLSGVFIDFNKYTLHYYFRNRFARAYLRASRKLKKGPKDTRIEFTGLDRADNLHMSKLRDQLPLHVINVALNLTGSKELEWQERKAESFTVSPLHSGSFRIGYRDSAKYGGEDGITLATAVSLSGAAVSPDMGYMMSSAVVRFLMALFNLRLGRWLGNPGPEGNNTYFLRSPRNMIRPIISEALGQTDEHSPYVYLSDGGHFENLGLYEMVLRRCRTILVVDASTDPDYKFESLAQAIRKVRIDFGIPIEFHSFPKIGRMEDGGGAHCALGKVFYSAVNAGCLDGHLIYIKPSLCGEEPRDILNYQTQNTPFPQEAISKQFFTESQFESYRALGQFIVRRLVGHQTPADLDAFRRNIEMAQPSTDDEGRELIATLKKAVGRAAGK